MQQLSTSIRVAGPAYDWLKDRSAETGIPVAQLVNILVEDAKRRGVSFRERHPVEIVEPS